VLFILHARLRAHRTPGIPCALCFQMAVGSLAKLARMRGEIAKLCFYFTSPRLRGEVK
jgi:hypothetical protein